IPAGIKSRDAAGMWPPTPGGVARRPDAVGWNGPRFPAGNHLAIRPSDGEGLGSDAAFHRAFSDNGLSPRGACWRRLKRRFDMKIHAGVCRPGADHSLAEVAR